MEVLLADKQDISRAGLMHILDRRSDVSYKYTEDKAELIEALKQSPECLVVVDYTLFDINDIEELIIIGDRFHRSSWLLFSEDLSIDFVKQVMARSRQFSIVTKESTLAEIMEAIDYSIHHRRFICQSVTEQLLTADQHDDDKANLTKTEAEILKEIAMGLTTKEIAEKRFSSFHTVNTHRKNIFRKLGVNNAHEAIKYALRSGLVDSAEYYI